MPNQVEDSQTEWNWSERRAGIDQWPEAQATITSIDQPYNNGKYDFLSVIAFTFKDATGEYFAGRLEMRTCDMPEDLMTGGSLTIRYNPKNPNKSWCGYNYWRTGFGRFQNFDYPIVLLLIFVLTSLAVAIIKIFHLHVR